MDRRPRFADRAGTAASAAIYTGVAVLACPAVFLDHGGGSAGSAALLALAFAVFAKSSVTPGDARGRSA